MPAATAIKKQDGAKAEVNSPSQIEQPQFAVAPFLADRHRALLRKGMCANLSDDQAEYFFEVVERTQLDPFEAQIWPQLRQSKDEQGVKHPMLYVLIKLQGFRAIGDRSNLLDGEDPVEWCGEDEVWKKAWLISTPPIAARARVHRKDRSRPQEAICLWGAYCQFVWDKQGREIPNAIWKRLGPHMLGKCALAGAYRGLFPRQASGVYLTEELNDGPDTESEASIEAEMTRRYTRDKEYWDAEKAKGHYPITSPKPAEPTNLEARVEPPVVVKPDHDDESPGPPSSEEPPWLNEAKPATAEDPRLDWRTFPLTRIRIFEGRALGSLTESEVRGLTPWLEKVSARWGAIDNDIKAHFHAIQQRLEYDKARASQSLDEELQSELDYGQITSQNPSAASFQRPTVR